MSFLPIVERELRVRARRRSTYRVRIGGAVLSILFVGGLLFISSLMFSPSFVGTFMFGVLAVTAFIGCLLEGVFTTADSLSSEKREGTLGLLFLTDLRGFDVVLGKLFATSINSVYRLIAIFPAMAVPLTLGGVTGGEIWRVVLVLLNTLFFSLSLGMLISTISIKRQRAWFMAMLCVAVPAVLPVLLPGGLSGGGPAVVTWSPSVAFALAFDDGYATGQARYWNSLVVLHLLGWFCLIAASVLLPRFWRKAGRQAPARVVPGRRTPAADSAEPGTQVHWASRRMLPNPLVWLVGGRESKPWFTWLVVVALGVGGFLGWWASGFDGAVGLMIAYLAILAHLCLACVVGVQACHAMSAARDSGMLEMLMTTPLSVPEIVRGMYGGLWRLYGPPLLFLAIVEMGAIVVQFLIMGVGRESLDGDVVMGTIFILLGLAATLMDVLATACFGLWMGLSVPEPGKAVLRTILYVVLLPLLGYLCCPFLANVIKNAVFIHIGHDRMLMQMRRIVTSRFEGAAETNDVLDDGDAVGKPTGNLPPVLPE